MQQCLGHGIPDGSIHHCGQQRLAIGHAAYSLGPATVTTRNLAIDTGVCIREVRPEQGHDIRGQKVPQVILGQA
ncbi:hypothetical protein D3C71_1614620 [compost metagenome]